MAVGHVTGPEKAIRAAQSGTTELLDSLLYYPNSLVFGHLGTQTLALCLFLAAGGLLARLILRRREKEQALRRAARLSRREREVLALLAEGGDNGSIAQALVISPETARTHIQNVLAKLGVHSRLEAAAFVVQNQILDDLVGVDR